MTMRKLRFSIDQLMILVAIAAGFFWVYRSVNIFAFFMLIGCGVIVLLQSAAYFQVLRGASRGVGRIFVTSLAVSCFLLGLVNVLVLGMLGGFFKVIMAFLITPISLGSGVAWIQGRNAPEKGRRGQQFRDWALVLGLVALELSMVFGNWPMRLAFLASRPALERLADRIEAGETLTSPEWAGVFRVIGHGRGHEGTPNISLTVGLDGSTNNWFVRSSTPEVPLVIPPQVYVSQKISADGRWWYQEED